MPRRSRISSRPTYHSWEVFSGMTRQVPGWTSETVPVPTHSYPHSPSTPALAGEHGTDSVYLPVPTLTTSGGMAPRYVWVTTAPDGSVTMQATVSGSAGSPAALVNVFASSATSLDRKSVV